MRKSSSFLALSVLLATVLACEQRPQAIDCDQNLNISVNLSLGKLPDTCVSKSANPLPVITWRSSDNSKLSVQIPDWNGTTPTATVNPYPTPTCDGTTTYCTSGPFGGGSIADETPIMYSLTMANGPTTKKIFGRIIIKK